MPYKYFLLTYLPNPSPTQRNYRQHIKYTTMTQNTEYIKKLAPYGTDGRVFPTDVSANFKVT